MLYNAHPESAHETGVERKPGPKIRARNSQKASSFLALATSVTEFG